MKCLADSVKQQAASILCPASWSQRNRRIFSRGPKSTHLRSRASSWAGKMGRVHLKSSDFLFSNLSKSTHLWYRFWGGGDDGISDEIDANPSQNGTSTQLGGCKMTCWDVWKIMNLAEMAGFHLKSAHLGGGKIKPRDVWKMNLCDDKKNTTPIIGQS